MASGLSPIISAVKLTMTWTPMPVILPPPDPAHVAVNVIKYSYIIFLGCSKVLAKNSLQWLRCVGTNILCFLDFCRHKKL